MSQLLLVALTDCEQHALEWRGKGEKSYVTFTEPGVRRPFSRGLNSDLFIASSTDFGTRWKALLKQLERSTDGRMEADEDEIDCLVYTAVVGYGAVTDLFRAGNRGSPGSFFEIVVGALLSVLARRHEEGGPKIAVPGTTDVESIPIDITLRRTSDREVSLAVPTKISTRERISQAYVHQRMLDVLEPEQWRSILCIANENNRGAPKQSTPQEKTVDNCWLVDTTVAGTIVQYERYTSHMTGLYYLDPPEGYLNSSKAEFPIVRRFSSLLRDDLPTILSVGKQM